MSLRISNIFRRSQTELQVIYFYENKSPNWRETWWNGLEKITLAKYQVHILFFTVSLPSLDNLVCLLGHAAIMNPFMSSNMKNWSSNISSEHFSHYCGCACYSELCKKTETITWGGILKPKMMDMEAAMLVKPSAFSGKCTTIKSSIYWSKHFAR